MPSSRSNRILNAAFLLFVLAFVFWLTAFKIFDQDFFWHVTAGRIMRSTGWLIQTDPFAYTREGLPYLATHEWLAQIIISLMFDGFGPTGVIILRSVLMGASLTLVLLIGRKNLWISSPLAVLAAITMQGGAMDRPHLWTWVMVAAFLFMSARILRRGGMRRWEYAVFLLLQVLWVNLHGGAAIVGIAVTGSLALQLLFDRWRQSQSIVDRQSLTIWLLPICTLIAQFLSPSGLGSLAYLYGVATEQSSRHVSEWQPRALAVYLWDLWPFWVAALSSLALTRRYLVFSVFLLGFTGLLSRMSFRHESIFVIAAAAITLLQLEENVQWRRIVDWLRQRFVVALLILAVLFAALSFYGRTTTRTLQNRFGAHGYGIVERTADATAFLDRENLSGKVFNTYDIGSELLYQFYPEPKVFVDSRNVDYGDAFLTPVFDAAFDPAAWRALEEKYGFTIAIVDHEPEVSDGRVPYVEHLQKNPQWIPVYLDDWVVIYVKDISEHRAVIDASRYRVLTPQGLRSGDVLQTTDLQALGDELVRAAGQSPKSIRARLLLARLLIAQGTPDQAEQLVTSMVQERPEEYRVHEMQGLLRAQQGRYDDAEQAFDAALSRLNRKEAAAIQSYVARIFESVGEIERAKRYR